MKKTGKKLKGRGAGSNPLNRFEKLEFEIAEEELGNEKKPKTLFYNDTSKSIITFNDSPDTGFDAGINPYRGCEHGCVYCYARPTHEFLGLSAGIDFETQIFVKQNAPELLRNELGKKKWKPQTVAISGNTDCYQPAEKHFKITRKCLEVLLDYRNPAGLITKNHLITRDIELLKEFASFNAVLAVISVTTLDEKLAGLMEPRTSRPFLRLKAIEELTNAGIPVMVLVAPVIPGLTDHEMPKIIEAAVNAGAKRAAYVMLRLPYSVSDLFVEWIETHYPNRKNKILNRIKSVRKGKLNSAEFGNRMVGDGIFAEQVKDIFKLACKRNGLSNEKLLLTTKHFRNPEDKQEKLF